MKISIIIDTITPRNDGGPPDNNRSKIWEGELEIKNKQEYLTMISVMAEGEMQPICQIPFALGIGHYLWIPPDDPITESTDDSLESRDF